MNVSIYNTPNINFCGFTSAIEERTLVNKALVDASCDIPTIIKANNKDERRERFTRCLVGWLIAFASPLITLPVTNRLAMKYVGKLANLFGKEASLIKISNKYLKTKETLKEGIKGLVQKNKDNGKNIDYANVINKCGGNYEVLRQKLINSKMSVLAFDFVFTSGTLGSIGFLNNYITKKKTGRKGFSAEFSMLEKDITGKRAKKYEEKEKTRKIIFAGLVLALASLPLLIRKGLLTNSTKGITGFLNKHAANFDYDDGIFMRRLPMLMAYIVSCTGISLAARDKTEFKDSTIRAVAITTAFFGGDIVIGSTLSRISDKLFKTNLLDNNCDKNTINKIFPPIKHIKDLDSKSKFAGKAVFWTNMACLSAIIGFALPTLMNKMIKHDVDREVESNQQYNKQNNVDKAYLHSYT